MQTEILKVTGMTCGGCTSKVTNALAGVAGVGEVDVSLSAGEATVRFDGHLTSVEALKSVLSAAGYGVDTRALSSAAPTKGGCCCH